MLHMGSKIIAGLFLASAMLAQAASADTITVCLDGTCDFTDPAAAVEIASPGDTIDIAAGTYYLEETVSVVGEQLTLRGAVDSYGEPVTVLDGQGALLVIGLGYADQAVIENIVITNGYGDYGGGARFIASNDVVVRNCHFLDNHANWNGGGIRLSLSTTLTLSDCQVSGNTAEHPEWGGQSHGAGAHISGATLILERTRVCGNVGSDGDQVSGSSDMDLINLGSCITNDCDSCVITELDADLNSDGVVGVDDLLIVIESWDGSGSADIDGDGIVGVTDLIVVLSAWG